ncbi:hypothetical protein [Synechococcus sp. CBW1107]|uniref:hypothetical protein n=1 Tax=Synechococcus sp. CBW1107 TaxID=2789857 RepID=UPI002AD3DAB9|nr:hypothetical protein [Synechococcus sp. CBW1107]CAK6697922.1 hypothetical protein IFHNHDMJ_02327 [Synechococcus sp. CBW1107]
MISFFCLSACAAKYYGKTGCSHCVGPAGELSGKDLSISSLLTQQWQRKASAVFGLHVIAYDMIPVGNIRKLAIAVT